MRFIIPFLALLYAFPHPASGVSILALGDSLIAGYGLPENLGFVPQLEQALRHEGVAANVINAGVSGDTSADGLARLDWSLQEGADLVLLEFGANDALRGLDPAGPRANIEAMIRRLKQRGIPILLLGMKAPRNLGPSYNESFDRIYPDLAGAYDVPLYGFFLEGVAAIPGLNQPDGIHPNERGVQEIVKRLVPVIKRIVAK